MQREKVEKSLRLALAGFDWFIFHTVLFLAFWEPLLRTHFGALAVRQRRSECHRYCCVPSNGACVCNIKHITYPNPRYWHRWAGSVQGSKQGPCSNSACHSCRIHPLWTFCICLSLGYVKRQGGDINGRYGVLLSSSSMGAAWIWSMSCKLLESSAKDTLKWVSAPY